MNIIHIYIYIWSCFFHPRKKKAIWLTPNQIINFSQSHALFASCRGIELSTVHVSEKIGKKSLNPNWQKETIDLNTLCSGNLHLPLVMSVYHHKSNGKHVLMGEMETSVSNLLSCQKSGSKLKLKKGGIKTGKILINRAETESLVIKISDEEIETTTTISFEDSETIQLVEQ